MATGNVPQALTHLSHISAALALADAPSENPDNAAGRARIPDARLG